MPEFPLWIDKIKGAFHYWSKLIISLRGIWCFLPAILGIIFVYWANNYSTDLILKEYHETLAICIMSIAVILFLIRSLLFRLEIDYILLTMAVNFLCREIHFIGTDNAVVIVAAIVLIWIFYRKDRIWQNIENAKLVQIALVGTAFTYFVAILVQRRVFDSLYLFCRYISTKKSFFNRPFSIASEWGEFTCSLGGSSWKYRSSVFGYYWHFCLFLHPRKRKKAEEYNTILLIFPWINKLIKCLCYRFDFCYWSEIERRFENWRYY